MRSMLTEESAASIFAILDWQDLQAEIHQERIREAYCQRHYAKARHWLTFA